MKLDETVSSDELTMVSRESPLDDLSSNNSNPEASQPIQEFATQSQVVAKLESVLVESVTQADNNPYLSFRKRIVRTLDYDVPVFHEDRIVTDPVNGESLVESIISYVANQIVVSSREPIDSGDLQVTLAATDWRLKEITDNRLTVTLESDRIELETVSDGIEMIASQIDLSSGMFVEPNRIFKLSATNPDDPIYSKDLLWGMNSAEDNDIDAPEGWDTATDASNIIVAIVDTGIRHTHEDLADNMWRNPGEIKGNGLDDDNNGYVDDYHGVNTIDSSLTWEDDNGHGTHVAGIVGASGNNGIGITGVAWKVQLMAVKAGNASGSLTLVDSIEAIDYAIDNGAHIINASWGGRGKSESLELAIERAFVAKVFFVASAGNESSNIDEVPFFPSGSPFPNVVTVASSDKEGNQSVFSNYGINKVDVIAPGSAILSCWYESDDSYALLDGTSMAAPCVSGILALNLSLYPNDDIPTHVDRLVFSSKSSDAFARTARSQGLVNLANSLAMDTVLYPPTIQSHSELDLYVKPEGSASMSVVAESRTEMSFEWEFEGVLLPGEITPELNLENLTESSEGEYRFIARNQDGIATISFNLNVLTADSTLSEGLDLDSGGIVFTRNEDLWDFVEDPESRDGDHIEGRKASAYEESSVEAVIRGPGELRFLWKMKDVSRLTYHPILYVDGYPISLVASVGEWKVEEVSLAEDKDYELKWSLWNSGEVGQGEGRLVVDYLKVFPVGEPPPIIYKQPDDVLAKPFDVVQFHIWASGTNLTFEWYSEGVLLESDDRWGYRIDNANTEDEGDYYVTVSNAFGSDTSRMARLEVDEAQTPAFFIERSKDYKGVVGNDLDITLEHGGSPTMTYKWSKDGVELPGETGPVLSFRPLAKAHSGLYKVVIENAFGPRQYSNSIWVQTIDTNISPDALLGERDLYTTRRLEGDSFEFDYFIETEFVPVQFQWYRGGLPIEGQTDRTLRLENLLHEDSGNYFIEVRNEQGSYRGGFIELVVDFGVPEALDDPDPNWSTGNEDHGWVYGQRVETFDGEDALKFSRRYPFNEVTSSDDGGFSGFVHKPITGPVNASVYWKRSSINGWFETHVVESVRTRLPDFPMSIFVEDGNVGDWQKSVIHIPAGGKVAAWLFVGTNPDELGWLDRFEITQEPAFIGRIPERIVAGSAKTSITIEAWGEGELSYQWYENDQAIVGAVSSTLEVDTATLQPSDHFYLIVTSEFGSARTSSFEVESIADRLDDRAQNFEFGGDAFWEWNPLGGVNSIQTFLDPGKSNWMEFEVSGPALVVTENSSGTVTVNGEAIEIAQWSGPSFQRSSFVYVGAGVNRVRIAAEISLDAYGRGGTRLSDFNVFDPVFIVKEDPASFGERSIFYKKTTTVYFAAVGPVDIRWYKNGNLVKEQLSSTSQYSRFFDDDDAPNALADVGTYYCEITDTHGNTARSEDFSISELDVRSFGEVIGNSAFLLCDSFYSFDYDSNIFVEGDSSAYVIIPEGPETAYFQVCIPYDPSLAYPVRKLSVRISGAGDETNVDVFDGDESFVSLENGDNWQSVTLEGESSNIYFDIRKSKSSELTIWIDGAELMYDLRILKQPLNYATYMNGTASFSVNAFSEESITYQWSKNGESIPGANERLLIIERVGFNDLGEYTVALISDGKLLVSEKASLTLTDDLASAIEMPGLLVSTWGETLWTVDDSVSVDGSRSVRSGEAKPGETSVIRLEFDSPGMYSVYMNREYDDGVKRQWEARTGISASYPFFEEFGFTDHLIGSSRNVQEVFLRLDRLSFSPLASKSYEGWIDGSAAISTATSDAGSVLFDSHADFDNDGISNLLEYLFDLDPYIKSELPVINLDMIGDRITANLSYRLAATGDYSVSLEISDDLENWYPVSPDTDRVFDASSKYYQIDSSVDLSNGPSDHYFLRWRTTKTGPVDPVFRTNAQRD